MTTAGAIVLILTAVLVGGWILDLIRRGRLYVGYGIVVLALIVVVALVSVVPVLRSFGATALGALYPHEPVAIVGLVAVLLLLIYVLHQLSVLSDRVATLTQELAMRRSRTQAHESEGDRDPSHPSTRA